MQVGVGILARVIALYFLNTEKPGTEYLIPRSRKEVEV